MRAKRIVAVVASASFWLRVVEVEAVEFPVLGVFGDPKNDGCKSVRAEEEGAYVAFNKGGETGENGEGGCSYKTIRRVSNTTYDLIGTCSFLEGKPAKSTFRLIVVDQDRIIYRKTRFVRCR